MIKIRSLMTLTMLLLFWLLLVDGELQSFFIGALFIGLALFASLSLTKLTQLPDNRTRLNLNRIPRFIWFFIVNSIKGGISTAKIAFSPQLNLSPTLIHYPTKYLVAGAPTQLFINLVSLLPGSVCVIREPTGVLIHVLNAESNVLHELYECEMAVCDLFDLDKTQLSVSKT